MSADASYHQRMLGHFSIRVEDFQGSFGPVAVARPSTLVTCLLPEGAALLAHLDSSLSDGPEAEAAGLEACRSVAEEMPFSLRRTYSSMVISPF